MENVLICNTQQGRNWGQLLITYGLRECGHKGNRDGWKAYFTCLVDPVNKWQAADMLGKKGKLPSKIGVWGGGDCIGTNLFNHFCRCKHRFVNLCPNTL